MPGIPGRGERIGSAYVRVYFSSAGGDDLKNQIESDGDFERAGIAAGNQAGDGFNDAWTKKLREGIEKDDKVMKRRGAAIKGNVTKITKEVGRIWDRFWKDQEASGHSSIRQLLEDMQELRAEVDRHRSRWEFFRLRMESLRETIRRLTQDLHARFDVAWFRIGRRLTQVRNLAGRLASRFTFLRTGLLGFGRLLFRIGDNLDVMGDKIGLVFGKRSRSEFLNIFGRVMQGVVETAGRLFKAFGSLFGLISGAGVKAFETAGDAAGEAAGSMTKASGALTEVGSAAAGAGASLGPLAVAVIPAVIVAAGALFLALQVAASAVMLLTGAVIALAAALSFALVGAAAAAYGALLPLIAILGVGILAFTNMSKEAKSAFKVVKDAFGDLGKVAAGELFKNASADAKQFSGVLRALTPVVREIAGWMRGFGEAMLDAISGPGGRRFVAFLQRVLPGMLASIQNIALNTGKFLADLFVAATPLARDFLGWLQGITEALGDSGDKVKTFSEQAGGINRPVGDTKSGLVGFLDRARESLKSVGGFIKEVLGLIGDLLGAGQDTGNTLFDDMTEQVRKFREFLRKAKEDGSLQKFFEDAKEIARQLGRAARKAGELMDKLDTPESRKNLKLILEILNKTIAVLGFIFWLFGKIQGIIERQVHDIMTLRDAIRNGLGKAWDFIRQKAAQAVEWIRSKWEAFTRWLSGLPGRLSWEGAFKTAATIAVNAVLGVFTTLPGQIVDLFRGLGGLIGDAIGSIDIDWPDPPGWLSKLDPRGLFSASGGIFLGPQARIIGEAGPEAVVPLARPLNQVDPAVRALSAFAQGLPIPNTTTVDKGRTIDVGGITVITPVKDPVAVAEQVVNRLAAATYIG